MGVSGGRKHTLNVLLSDGMAPIGVRGSGVLGITVGAVPYTHPEADPPLVLAGPFKFPEMLCKMPQLLFCGKVSDKVGMRTIVGRMPTECRGNSIIGSRPE